MAAATKYRVSAAAIVAKLKDTQPSEVYLYRGAPVPPNVDPEHLKHLLGIGLVEKYTVAETPPAPAPTGTDGSGDPPTGGK